MVCRLPLQAGYKRYKVGISYDGQAFSGWVSGTFEKQAHLRPSKFVKDCDKPSVITMISMGLSQFIGQDRFMNLKGSSRTDSGVHALRNTFQIDLNHGDKFKPDAIVCGMNQEFQRICKGEMTLAITDASLESPDFDVRSDATSRTYMYRILTRSESNYKTRTYPSIFHDQRSWWFVHNLDIEKMRQAAQMLVGEMDYSSFRSKKCNALHGYRRIDSIDIQKIEFNHKDNSSSINLLTQGNDYIVVTVTGNAFLRKMVRNVVGSLVAVGNGVMSLHTFEKIITQKNRTLNPGITAPAHGLYLVDVYYDKGVPKCFGPPPGSVHDMNYFDDDDDDDQEQDEAD